MGQKEIFMQASITKEHLHGKRASQGVSGSISEVAVGGGKRVVLTAPFNESIAQAGFFIEMALASITPVAILDKKHPK
jgi:hypothetical protein